VRENRRNYTNLGIATCTTACYPLVHSGPTTPEVTIWTSRYLKTRGQRQRMSFYLFPRQVANSAKSNLNSPKPPVMLTNMKRLKTKSRSWSLDRMRLCKYAWQFVICELHKSGNESTATQYLTETLTQHAATFLRPIGLPGNGWPGK
jgi:hypothetical protein